MQCSLNQNLLSSPEPRYCSGPSLPVCRCPGACPCLYSFCPAPSLQPPWALEQGWLASARSLCVCPHIGLDSACPPCPLPCRLLRERPYTSPCQGGGGLPWTPRVSPRCAFVSLEPLVTSSDPAHFPYCFSSLSPSAAPQAVLEGDGVGAVCP